MKPDLRDSFAETRDLRDALQILTVRVRVDLEIGLQDLQLFLRERRPHSFRLFLVV
mgnify:CR=1 FL=1